MNSIDIIRRHAQAHREAGVVQRMHIVPCLTDTSIARHSWNMAILLWLLHPKPSLKLILRTLTHDNAERWLGDVPSPAKYSINPEIGVAMKESEDAINKVLGIDFDLTEDEMNWSRGVDLLDFMMFCEDELNMGNLGIRPSLENARRHILESEWVPTKIKVFAKDYVWERTRDVIDGELFGSLETNE